MVRIQARTLLRFRPPFLEWFRNPFETANRALTSLLSACHSPVRACPLAFDAGILIFFYFYAVLLQRRRFRARGRRPPVTGLMLRVAAGWSRPLEPASALRLSLRSKPQRSGPGLAQLCACPARCLSPKPLQR